MNSADFLPPSSGSGPADSPGCVVDLPSLDGPFILSANGRLLAWQTHVLAPPPTDLITVLQRLTI